LKLKITPVFLYTLSAFLPSISKDRGAMKWRANKKRFAASAVIQEKTINFAFV